MPVAAVSAGLIDQLTGSQFICLLFLTFRTFIVLQVFLLWGKYLLGHLTYIFIPFQISLFGHNFPLPMIDQSDIFCTLGQAFSLSFPTELQSLELFSQRLS